MDNMKSTLKIINQWIVCIGLAIGSVLLFWILGSCLIPLILWVIEIGLYIFLAIICILLGIGTMIMYWDSENVLD